MNVRQLGAALLVLAAAACAKAPGREPERAGTYTPRSVVLYLARSELIGACGDDRSPSIRFAPGTPELPAQARVELEKWALCLQRPELAKAGVVLLPPGGVGDGGKAALYERRARELRDSLAARGVDPARVTIGAPSAGPERGPESATDAITLEVTRPAPAAR
jgi:hypothetical protein